MKHTQYCSIAYSLYCNCYQSKCESCDAIGNRLCESCEPIITIGELLEGCE